MQTPNSRLAPYATFVLFLLIALPTAIQSQIRPVYDEGLLGITQLQRRIGTNASALMIGAHPDDEDTALLAYLARGEYARTAYLSLTRGDGGQNIIGPELGEALGVIRTEELLQARRLDGATQFFTRAYDYGFSKTLAEAKEKWDEKIILCDAVRAIRTFKPWVVISVFTGTPVDGHGQHQYAGYIAPLAVKAAADPAQCTDAGKPWEVKKFYVRHRGAAQPTININTGKLDPLFGRSYFEIAMRARSQHRSQEQGTIELKGDQFSGLDLVFSTGKKVENETSVFDGLNIVVPPATSNEGGAWTPDWERFGDWKELTVAESGLRVDVLADRDIAVPGESVPVTVRFFAPKETTFTVDAIKFNLPTENVPTSPTDGEPSFRREVARVTQNFKVNVPSTRPLTQPFWLTRPRDGALYSPLPDSPLNQPFGPPAAYADIDVTIGDQKVTLRRPVEYRYADDIRGEIRRDLNIVPKIAIGLDRELVIVSTRDKQKERRVAVNLVNNASGPSEGTVSLNVPDGWQVTPASSAFAMKRRGEKTSATFSVNIPANASAGSYSMNAVAKVGGDTFSQTMQTIAYEHIQTHRIYRSAKADVKLIDLQTAPLRVGYIRGSGDRVPDAIKQMGVDFTEIDEATLASGDLRHFDTIVVGIRAYQVRPDVVANNQRLLDFVSAGGTLIVQYQLPPTYAQQNLTPYPTQMGPRVVDENATVTIVDSAHPIFNFPNKITADDFAGWVQERNLYNFVQMDPKYVGLLESHDAGEPENKGGLVIANIGKGNYVYCSYSLFRQLPAGVPGAYRLLANMISLPKAPR